VRHCVLGKDT